MLKAGYSDSSSTVDARSTAVWPFPPYCSTGFGADGCQRNMSVLSLQNNSILTWNPSTQFPACFNRWPSYREMTIYNIIGTCWFHKTCGQPWQVADLQGWPTLQVLQYNYGHVSACLPTNFSMNIMPLQSFPSYAFFTFLLSLIQILWLWTSEVHMKLVLVSVRAWKLMKFCEVLFCRM